MEKININGKEFNLNTERAKELGVLTPILPPFKTRAVGEYYKIIDGMFTSSVYMLAHCGQSKAVLINIGNIGQSDLKVGGGLWSEAVLVRSLTVISESEWKQISAGKNFVQVNIKLTEK
jgi:hypothetical protein